MFLCVSDKREGEKESTVGQPGVASFGGASRFGYQRIGFLSCPNTAEMGDEIWGVEAASQAYFRSPARGLSMDQAAMLAGLLPF